MAEAIVEDIPQTQRFYCHVCNSEVPTVNADFTCPLCSGGFIEELPATSDQSSDDSEMADIHTINDFNWIRDEIDRIIVPEDVNLPRDQDQGAEDDRQENGEFRRPRNRNPRRIRMRNLGRLDNILLEVLQSLSGGNEVAVRNASMFFMGNPGDYAWGREGIDAIVTQLLNQMDTTGPPPLPKDKIDEIPHVNITKDQVEEKLQCSVCWEDFLLCESVRKLPCLHFYHENCIVPWLELHGTCPICRKCLSPDMETPNNLRHDDQVINIRSIENNINPASSQVEAQIADHVNIIGAIPLSLSRIFSQPGPSSQIPTFAVSPTVAAQSTNEQFRNRRGAGDGDGGGGSGDGGNSRSRYRRNRNGISRRNNHSDIYKYDDGNIEYEFD